MKIGLVIYGPLNERSGGFLYDCRLVDHLAAQGETVELISLPEQRYATSLAHNWSPQIIRQLTRFDGDLLLQDELNHPSLFRLNRQLRGRWPIVSIVHHLRSDEPRAGWRNRGYAAVERRYLNGVDGFIFNSKTTKRRVFAQAAAKPHLVATPGGDRFGRTAGSRQATIDITPTDIADRCQQTPFQLLYVGNWQARKGLRPLVQALAWLLYEQQLPVHLTIAGDYLIDPVFTAIVESDLAKADLLPHVTITGRVSDAKLAELMQQSHLLVLPSSYEGFGIVYLEAMQFGLPALGTTAGAAHEVIVAGETGFLVPPDNARALAQHVHRLATDRAQLATMSLAAQKRYARFPTWAQSMDAIHQFLQELVR